MKFNLKEFFGICKHKWKEKERIKITKHYTNGAELEGMIIIQECIKCGKLKEYRI